MEVNTEVQTQSEVPALEKVKRTALEKVKRTALEKVKMAALEVVKRAALLQALLPVLQVKP